MFAQDTPDVEWIMQVAKLGMISLTRDKRIGKRPIELHAVYASGLRLFVLDGGSLPSSDLSRSFIHAVPSVIRFAAKHQAPFIAKVAHRTLEAKRAKPYVRLFRSHLDLQDRFR